MAMTSNQAQLENVENEITRVRSLIAHEIRQIKATRSQQLKNLVALRDQLLKSDKPAEIPQDY